VVIGSGAMAGALAGRLARSARSAVTLAGTWTAALDAIAGRGLRIEEPDGSYTVRPAVRRLGVPVAEAERADVAVVAVKSTQTRDVAPALAGLVSPDGLVVTLQNGLGNREVLSGALGSHRVALGVATLGATLVGPGEVRFFPGRLELGAEPPVREAVVRLAALFEDAGLATEVCADIRPAQWRKLAANCAINPLTAVHRCLNGELLDDPARRRQLEQAAREVGTVADALGLPLGDAAAHAAEVAHRTAANRSSMLQDVERGRPTEIDALCGAVVAEGERAGVPTPLNHALWLAVRRLEGRPVAESPAAEEARSRR
jgi:2-dehydropantoate 2-reductase